MHQCCRVGVGDHLKLLHNGAHITLALRPVRERGSFDSVPQLRYRDGGDLQFFTGSSGQPFDEVKAAFFALNDHIGIEDYRHRSLGGFRILRAAFSSLCHALASASDRSTFLSASANSGPVQTFLLSGTRRATGAPFFSRTYVTF